LESRGFCAFGIHGGHRVRISQDHSHGETINQSVKALKAVHCAHASNAHDNHARFRFTRLSAYRRRHAFSSLAAAERRVAPGLQYDPNAARRRQPSRSGCYRAVAGSTRSSAWQPGAVSNKTIRVRIEIRHPIRWDYVPYNRGPHV
jgi:hypothetical protein